MNALALVKTARRVGVEYPPFCTRCHLSRDCSRWPSATACLSQLHSPALARAARSPSAAPGSYSRLSPITWRSLAFGWSPLCCAWPRAVLTVGTAHLAVSVGWFTPRAQSKPAQELTVTANPPEGSAEAREKCGEVPLARRAPATPGPQRLRSLFTDFHPRERGTGSWVPKERFELSRAIAHYALNVARLPIPPLRLAVERGSPGDRRGAFDASHRHESIP